jgi:hypothetical protein
MLTFQEIYYNMVEDLNKLKKELKITKEELEQLQINYDILKIQYHLKEFEVLKMEELINIRKKEKKMETNKRRCIII